MEYLSAPWVSASSIKPSAVLEDAIALWTAFYNMVQIMYPCNSIAPESNVINRTPGTTTMNAYVD